MVHIAGIICTLIMGTQAAVNSWLKSYPTTVRTVENDTVLLPCYVDNPENAQLRLRWWRGGISLADSGEPQHMPPERVRMYSNGSLEVAHVQRNDTGQYVCQVSSPGPWGHATQAHEIEVIYPPSVRPIPESGRLDVKLGEKVDMACEAKGVPLPIITWTKKDGETEEATRLSFHAHSPDVAGCYTCTANNGVGQPATAHIELFVNYKPKIEMSKTWVHGTPGIRVQLDCRVTACPEVKVDWYFNDKNVVYSSRIVKHNAGSDHSLVIRNVRIADYGYYLCRASNLLGTTEAAVELSGIANPASFKNTSHSISRTSYNFVWEVYSYSFIIEYEFRFRKYSNGVWGQWRELYIPSGTNSISPIHTRSFNLTGLSEATRYEAVVFSKNRYGWSQPSEIFRFATEGAVENAEEDHTADSVQEEKLIPVIQLASMSQHSPLADKEEPLVLLLPQVNN
ncbi:hypothetical protein KM043_000701 [Ampulex compressa]|nr:hypothetical protein KM043_000701 [Ampulex compressa]